MHFVLSYSSSLALARHPLSPVPGCCAPLPAFFSLASCARSPRRAIPLYSDLLFILTGKYHGRVPTTGGGNDQAALPGSLFQLSAWFTRARTDSKKAEAARESRHEEKSRSHLVPLRLAGTIHVGESDSEPRFTRLKGCRKRDNSRGRAR